MLMYDKVIIDTSNIFYRVADLYLKDLKQDTANQLMRNNTIFTHFKSVIEGFENQTFGEVCLLFDPMISNGSMSTRLKIKEGYKTTRDKNSPVAQLKRDTLEKLYSEFLVEPRARVSVYHDVTLEADDFVEKLTETGNCLMITSDKDFARYLETGRVEMLTSGLSIKETGIYTADDFEKQEGFRPTIASVTFWKAMYGDVSDNIVGSFKDPSTKVIVTASQEMKEILVDLGNKLMTLEEAKAQFFAGTGRFEKLAGLLRLSNTDRSYEKLLDLTDANFAVIESMLPRSSDIPVSKYKIAVDMIVKQQPPAKKFSLNKKV